jgi:hypothetical protein
MTWKIARHFSIVTGGLVLNLDAANPSSYPGTGTTWTDLSGNGNNGTLVNGVGYSGDNFGSLSFDGVNDYIVKDTISAFGVYCISMWIRPSTLVNASSSGKSLIQLRYQAAAGNFAWYISLGAATSLVTNEYITIQNAANGRRTSVADGGSLIANAWYNLVFNFESNIYKIYVNNVVKTTTSGSSVGNVSLLTNPNKLYLSTHDGDGAPPRLFFDGNISQASIYNRALTPEEIQQNFNALKGRYGL